MRYLVAALAGIAAVILLFMSIRYYRAKQKGKGYIAVAAITGIGTTWAAYISLLAVPWRVVLVALFNADPQLAIALEPNTTAILASTFGLIVVDSFLYGLASKSMRTSRLPINASAEEVEDLTGAASVLALAFAHLRFRFAGKADNPIRLPGESPYKLPDPQREPDWTALAADLLVQLEPNLVRETFRWVHERQLFVLSGTDVLDPTREISWLVCAIPSKDHIAAAVDLLDRVASASKLDGQTTLAICIDSVDQTDEVEHTPGQHELRILSKTALVNKGLDLSFYVASLIRRFEQRVVPGADYTLRDCFVSPKVRKVRSGEARLTGANELNDGDQYDLLDYLQAWADQPGVDHISIIGEFGQGKSTALLAYCCDWANRWKAGDRSARVPLLIELRGKSPRRQAPDRFLAEWGDRYGLRGSALLNLIQSGRANIIFEGFDEVQDAGLRYDRFEQFKALWGFSYPGTKIIFTGRPNFFLDTLERQTLLRASQAARDAGLANSEIFALAFLDRKGIATALAKYPPGTVQEILAPMCL